MGVVVNTVKVSLGSALPAGSNIIGAVTQSGAWSVSISGTPTVTVGNASIPVTDNGGSLTVDGTVGVSGTVTVGTHAVTQSGTWTVGVQGTGASDIGKAEDAVHTSGDTGIAIWGVRNDSQTVLTSATGDYSPIAVDSAGRVQISDGAGSLTVDGTVAATQSGTWNIGSITTLPALATGANVIGAVTQSGTWNIGSITTLPALAAGTNAIGKLAANSGVDIGDVDVTSVVPGTAATNLGKAEDAAHASGDVGVMALAVRNDNAATVLTSADGDYSAFAVDAEGVQFTKSSYRPTPYVLLSAATTNATSISATANTLLLSYYIANLNGSAWKYVKFYNKASAPTVGTDTPVVVLAVPPNGAANLALANGMNFTTGLAMAVTSGIANSDTSAVALNEVVVNLTYAVY